MKTELTSQSKNRLPSRPLWPTSTALGLALMLVGVVIAFGQQALAPREFDALARIGEQFSEGR